MKKNLTLVLTACFTMTFAAVASGQNLAVQAKQAQDNSEWVRAAQLWQQEAQLILSANNTTIEQLHEVNSEDFARCIVDLYNVGNCYYMIDDNAGVQRITTQLYETLEALKIDTSPIPGERELVARYYKLCADYMAMDDKNIGNEQVEMFFEYATDYADPYNKAFNKVLKQDRAEWQYRCGNYTQALALLNEVAPAATPLEMSQKAMCLARLGVLNADVRLFNQAIDSINAAVKSTATKSRDYGEMLRKKAKILTLRAATLGETVPKEAHKCYEDYFAAFKQNFAASLKDMNDNQRERHWLTMQQFVTDAYRMANYAPETLYDMALYTKGYLLALAKNPKTLETKWTQVQKKLGNDDCALEFVQYLDNCERKRLGCLVLHKGDKKPLFVDMVSVDSLLSIEIDSWWNDVVQNALTTSTDYTAIDAMYQSEAVARAIWTPALVSAIGNARNIYFAPDGVLHQIAIEYIAPMTDAELYRLSSTRVLVSQQRGINTDRMLIMGGMPYSIPIDAQSGDNDAQAFEYLYDLMHKNNYEFNDLSGALNEVNTIAEIRNNPHDEKYDDSTATDELFFARAPEFPVIHISTHGFFNGLLEAKSDWNDLCIDNPLSRSGVIFAGAQYRLSNTDFDLSHNDCIVSAREIADMNLTNTDLVVLSACETAQGYVTADGLYGMQRALKIAGVKAMILSLWDVDDAATNHLMQIFYNNLQSDPKHNVHKAFMDARKSLMQTEYVSTRFTAQKMIRETETLFYDLPRYHFPFILIDVF